MMSIIFNRHYGNGTIYEYHGKVNKTNPQDKNVFVMNKNCIFVKCRSSRTYY